MNQTSIKSSCFILLLALFFICTAATAAQAQLTLTVTRTDDRNNPTCAAGDCSLREAINEANTAPTNDTINFAIPAGNAGCAGGVCTITLTLGQLTINSAATAGTLLITNSTGASNLLISGNNASRVFLVNAGANLTLDGVTVTKGKDIDSGGGGIFNSGTLTLTNSIVSGNTVQPFSLNNADGGGIYNNGGTVTITNSTVSGNTATPNPGGTSANGGGIYSSNGTVTLTNSTVSGNTATASSGTSTGGGISGGGTVTLTNSTVSGNTARVGGGIYHSGNGTLNLTSVTIAYNSVPSGGGSGGGVNNVATATANLRNTIIAKNNGPASAPDFSGPISATSTFNLIGDGSGTTGITNGSSGNQVGIDPMLDSTLALNGGATPSYALLPGSPAIDAGNDTGTDQRGFARPVNQPSCPEPAGGNTADIGAYELQGSTAATVSISGQVITATGRGIKGVMLSLTDSNGNVRTTVSTPFGYYRFDAVEVGETYILQATGKHFTFSQPVQVLNVNEEANQVNFIADSDKSKRVF